MNKKVLLGILILGGAGVALWYFFLRKEEEKPEEEEEEKPEVIPAPKPRMTKAATMLPSGFFTLAKALSSQGCIDTRLMQPADVEGLLKKGWKKYSAGSRTKPIYYICAPGKKPNVPSIKL